MKKVVGIVAEFNPLHDGHRHLLSTVKRELNDPIVVIAMSGNTVQRGEFAIEDKFNRTSAALDAGADIVVEMPTLTTLNNANRFGEGAVKLLDNFNINMLAFGTESDDPDKIMTAVETMVDDDFDMKMKMLVKETQSYPIAFATLMGLNFQANDILAVSYLAAALKNQMDFDVYGLKREPNMPTASGIRKQMIKNNPDVLNMDHFWDVVKGILLTTDSEDDLIKYLKKQLSNGCYSSWYAFVEGSANKSFTKARISRELLKFVLNLKEQEDVKYRVLGATPEGLKHLKTCKNYTTTFNPDNKNELMVAEFIDMKFDGYKEKEISRPIIIYQENDLDN